MSKKRTNNSQTNHKNKNKKLNNDEGSTSSNSQRLDPVFGQYKALPISQDVLNSITPNTIPTDAETYLAMVRKQAESGSSVMFIPKAIDYDDINTNSESIESDKSNNDETSVINEEYNKHLDQILNEYEQEKAELPEIGEVDIPSSFIFPNNFTEWRKFCLTNKPELGIISNLDHPLTIKLIIYATKWLNGNTSKNVSLWIYALLIRVSSLLENTDISILRDLGVKARRLNQRDDIGDVTKFTVEFILVIVSRFYGQRDLDPLA